MKNIKSVYTCDLRHLCTTTAPITSEPCKGCNRNSRGHIFQQNFALHLSATKGHSTYINPLNAELNPSCHLLVLLGNLTFMGSCIVSILQYTRISNKMQRNTVYLYLETALHVSGGTSTTWRTPPTARSNRFQLFHDSGR
jgi:hypothetical protein